MKKLTTLLTLNLILIFGNACATSGPNQADSHNPEKPLEINVIPDIRTTLGYTIPQARENMALTPNPYDISISECYTMDGKYIPELNQLRMRLINDYTSRSGKKFIEQYNHQTLYPRNR